MKTEKKNSNGGIEVLKYLRELSIVALGIAITFIVSDCIGKRNQQKDMKRHLNAVKLELEENLKIVQEKADFYELAANFSNYLLSTDYESLNPDSLEKFNETIRYVFVMTYKTSAFEMLKISGAMRLIKNEEMLRSILESYTLLEEAKYNSDIYMNKKLTEIYEFFIENQFKVTDIFINENSRLYSFFALYMNVEDSFQNCAAQIKYTLKML